MKTAVEWLEDELKANLKKVILEGDSELMESLFEQAKEMEKKQLVDFTYLIADDLACGVYTRKHIEDMFDQTFKSE